MFFFLSSDFIYLNNYFFLLRSKNERERVKKTSRCLPFVLIIIFNSNYQFNYNLSIKKKQKSTRDFTPTSNINLIFIEKKNLNLKENKKIYYYIMD